MTLDEDIRVLPARQPRFSRTTRDGGRRRCHVILELKYRYNVPAIFKRLVEEFALEPQRSSEYRLGMIALGGESFAGAAAIDGTATHA